MKYNDLSVVKEIDCSDMASVTGGFDVTWGTVVSGDVQESGVGFAQCPVIDCLKAANGQDNLGQLLSKVAIPAMGAPGKNAAWYQASAQQCQASTV